MDTDPEEHLDETNTIGFSITDIQDSVLQNKDSFWAGRFEL